MEITKNGDVVSGGFFPVWSTIDNTVKITGVGYVTVRVFEGSQMRLNKRVNSDSKNIIELDLSVFSAVLDKVDPRLPYNSQKIEIEGDSVVSFDVICLDAPNITERVTDVPYLINDMRCIMHMAGKYGVYYDINMITKVESEFGSGVGAPIQEGAGLIFCYSEKSFPAIELKPATCGVLVQWLNSAGGFDWAQFDTYKITPKLTQSRYGNFAQSYTLELTLQVSRSDVYWVNRLISSPIIEVFDGDSNKRIKARCLNNTGVNITGKDTVQQFKITLSLGSWS